MTEDVGEKILTAIRGGMMRYEACATAGISTKTLKNWEKAAAAGDEYYGSFVEELDIAQHEAQGELMKRHHAISRGSRLDHEGAILAIDGESVPATRVQLEAIQFQLRNGGTRPWADMKKLELTGKDGERLSGAEVTPAAAAALVRAEFGDQARQALAEGEGDPDPAEPAPRSG